MKYFLVLVLLVLSTLFSGCAGRASADTLSQQQLMINELDSQVKKMDLELKQLQNTVNEMRQEFSKLKQDVQKVKPGYISSNVQEGAN